MSIKIVVYINIYIHFLFQERVGRERRKKGGKKGRERGKKGGGRQ